MTRAGRGVGIGDLILRHGRWWGKRARGQLGCARLICNRKGDFRPDPRSTDVTIGRGPVGDMVGVDRPGILHQAQFSPSEGFEEDILDASNDSNNNVNNNSDSNS